MEPVAVDPDIYQVPLGIVNVFLMLIPGGLLLIDTGPGGSELPIFEAAGKIGYLPAQIKYIVVTHSHYDHSGALAAIVKETGAPVFMHPLDAALVKRGVAFRFRSKTLNGLVNLLTMNSLIKIPRLNIKAVSEIIPVTEGDWIPDANGLQVIYAPGHWPGQIALYSPRNNGILIVADIAENHGLLRISPQNDNLNDSMATLKKISSMKFNIALFSHGQPILRQASGIFKEVFGYS
jgi:glyoxylase-like metal-dependent hydrolase (beta-lactamase superfamily II)